MLAKEMFYNKVRNLLILILISITSNSFAEIKDKIIQNLEDTTNISFNFEQNINGKIENGDCVIQYPKKIYCNYELADQKILVSNGNSLVIKTNTSYYLYQLDRTPLNLILNKKFLVSKIKVLNERIIDEKFVNYRFVEKDNEINIFFNKTSYELIGWQTLDIYQNLSITYISKIKKNKKLKKKLFDLPQQN